MESLGEALRLAGIIAGIALALAGVGLVVWLL